MKCMSQLSVVLVVICMIHDGCCNINHNITYYEMYDISTVSSYDHEINDYHVELMVLLYTNVQHDNERISVDSMRIECKDNNGMLWLMSGDGSSSSSCLHPWYFHPLHTPSTVHSYILNHLVHDPRVLVSALVFNESRVEECHQRNTQMNFDWLQSCQLNVDGTHLPLKPLNEHKRVQHHRIVWVDEPPSRVAREQIPSLVELNSVVSGDSDFEITLPATAKAPAKAQTQRALVSNASSSSNELRPRFRSTLGEEPEESPMDPDEIVEGLGPGFDETTPTDDEGDGQIASNAMVAFGFILNIIVEAALGDSIEEAAEELEEHISKVSEELISEHLNEEAFYDGTEGRRRRLLSIRNLLTSTGVSTEATNKLMMKHQAKTPPFAIYAIENLIPELSASITNEISLSYVEMLTNLLHKAIHDHLDQGDVASQITEQVHITVTSGAKKNLQKTVPLAVQRILPPLIIDPLIHDLTHTMTRSLTHVLAPTLTFTLSHTAAEHLACAFCRAHGSWCNQCVAHPDEIYRKIYVADYYSSYYTDYYIPRLYQPI